MSFKSIFSEKNAIDFIYMFFSTIAKKGLGFLREIILAAVFGGSSIMLAQYFVLKTVSDLFSQLTVGNALQANLMPKFTKLYKREGSINLTNVFNFSKHFSLKLFLVSQMIQLPMIWYVKPERVEIYFAISILLGVVMSVNFFNAIFLTILQAKGKFKRHSFATTLNLFVSTFLLYPFALVFEVIGVVFSRLIGTIALAIIYIRPLIAEKGDVPADLSTKDFNLSIMILGNFANIIMLLPKFIAYAPGSGGDITFLNFAIVLLNIFLTAVVMNVNTLVLKIISVKKDYRVILVSALISTVIGGVFIFLLSQFSDQIVSFAFERGKFVAADTAKTSCYIKDISWSFLFIFIASALFQSYFTLPQSYLRKNSKYLARPFIISILLLLGYFFLAPLYKVELDAFFGFLEIKELISYTQDVRSNSLIMIYSLSFISFVLSIIGFIKYYRYEV